MYAGLFLVYFETAICNEVIFMNNKALLEKYHIIIAVLGIFFIIIFTLQNSETVSINLLFWKMEMSRVVLILAVLIIGFLLGYIYHGTRKK